MSKAIATIVSWLALAAVVLPVWAAPTVSVGSATVHTGDTFTIEISIVGAESLQAWQFDLAFDPAILQANSISEGSFMPGFGATLFVPGVIDNGSGLITLTADLFVDLDPYPSGDGVLAQVEFLALAVGTSDVVLSNVLFDFGSTDPALGHGLVTVIAPVPEPGTLALSALGLGVVALRGRRKGRGDSAV